MVDVEMCPTFPFKEGLAAQGQRVRAGYASDLRTNWPKVTLFLKQPTAAL